MRLDDEANADEAGCRTHDISRDVIKIKIDVTTNLERREYEIVRIAVRRCTRSPNGESQGLALRRT